MTRLGPALALIACAGLGYLAGSQKPATVACTPAPMPFTPPPATPDIPRPVVVPFETPLVEQPEKPAGPADGTLSPGGNFRYEAKRNAYIPVDLGQVWHSHNKRRPTAEHLIATHGHAPTSVAKWTQQEIEICHANDHAAEYAAKQAARASSGHWEVQQVCTRRGCDKVRVWVQD